MIARKDGCWVYSSDGRYATRVNLRSQSIAFTPNDSATSRDGKPWLELLGHPRIIRVEYV